MIKTLFAFGLLMTTCFAHADEGTVALKEGDRMNDVAQSIFSVTQVSPRLETSDHIKYRVAVVDYGAGLMAPSNLIVYVSTGDIGGEAGYENAYYIEANIFDVKSFTAVKNEVVLKVRQANNEGKLVISTIKLQFDHSSKKLLMER